MVSIFNRLYRTDEDLFSADQLTGDCMVIYDLNETQPYLSRAKFVDPNMTRAYIDSAKMGAGRKKIWGNLDGNKIYQILIPIVIIGSIVYAFLTNGGF